MSEFRPSSERPLIDQAAPSSNVRDGILLGLMLFTLVRSSEALAGEQALVNPGAIDPEMGDFRQSSPASPGSPAATSALRLDSGGLTDVAVEADKQTFSSTEFRPRKRSSIDIDPAVNGFGDAPMLHGTTVWQRMADYKSFDRVRVLTLWESRGSTVSLQAGRRGDPSLQWTSRIMNRGGSTRGLLDRLFSVSLAGAGKGLRGATHSAGAPAGSAQQATGPVVAGLK
jgi:hypothetical protein